MSGSAAPDACLDYARAGRPMVGEHVSGDLALHVLHPGGSLLGVLDGLGHGPEARHAAERARDVVAACAGRPVDELVRAAHDELASTRGVAMTLADAGCDGRMRWLGVGNVEAHVLRLEGYRVRRVASPVLFGGVVGYRLPRLRASTVELEPGDLVVMVTDGITDGFVDQVAAGDPPGRIAATLVDRCTRGNDDAEVVVARYLGPAR
ncbi:MAG TPA: SpoIIE family protein phosphatase [Acidimicrobiales bacterium]